MSGQEAYAISANLVEAMCFFGRALQNSEIVRLPGVCLISCGLNYAAFNAAVLSEPIGWDFNEARRRIELPVEHYQKGDLRWTYWLCEGLVDPRLGRGMRGLFERFGLSPLTDPPGMFADRLFAPKRKLPALTVKRVEDEWTRRDFSRLTSVAFEIPPAICDQIYSTPGPWEGSFEGYVGYIGNTAITTTATVITSGVVGVYSVGTLPQCRRRGYAEATMREALRLAHERTGIEATVLQSTPSGVSLYERMGYRKHTKFHVYIS